MTLAAYQHLMRTNNKSLRFTPEDSLGVALPELTSATLSLTTKMARAASLQAIVTGLTATCGWAAYRDEVVLSAELNDRYDIIEAEFTNGDVSIAIKHICADHYQVIEMKRGDEPSSDTVYKQQELYVRSNLSRIANIAGYRIWYQRRDHKWRPYAQQFTGFSDKHI